MEQMLKKKLQTFLNDMLKFGTVRGFKYFSMYLRGREEIIVRILNEPQNLSDHHSSGPTSPTVVAEDFNPSSSFNSRHLPYDKQSLLISQRSQQDRSGLGLGLPPASPSEEEPGQLDPKSTVFMIAGYAKYNCPYVWVRSNHSRLVKLAGEEADGGDRDSPLRLKTSAKWKDTDVKIWDIISELIKLCTYPVPRNPFEIDVDYIDCLPLKERVLVTAGLTHALQQIILHTKDEKHYSGKVFDDLHLVTRKHFESLQDLARRKQIPGVELFLEEERKQQQQQRRQSQTQARASGRKRYPSQTYTEQAAAAYGLAPMYGGPEVQSTLPADHFSQYNQYGRQNQGGFGYGQAPSMF